MFGLLILGIIAAYAWFWVFVARRFKARWVKVAIALVAVLIPTWDLIPQGVRFRELCEREAGQHFYAEPIVVEGFYGPSMGRGGAADFVEHEGYRYIETKGPYQGVAGQLLRIEQGPGGEIVRTKIDRVTSRYELSDFRERRGWGLSVAGQRVIDRETGAVLADDVSAYKGGNWIFRSRAFRAFPAGGDPCHGPPQPEALLPTKFLLPANPNHKPNERS